jgi:hypothetical protein
MDVNAPRLPRMTSTVRPMLCDFESPSHSDLGNTQSTEVIVKRAVRLRLALGAITNEGPQIFSTASLASLSAQSEADPPSRSESPTRYLNQATSADE